MKDPQTTSTREAWVLCLILGAIMLNFPFLQIFNTGHMIFGIPTLIFYFFVGWPISILIIFIFALRLQRDEKNGNGSGGEDD